MTLVHLATYRVDLSLTCSCGLGALIAAHTHNFVAYQKIGIELEEEMPLGLIQGIGRAFRRKRTSSLDILTSKNSPRGFYKGKNCKPTGFHTRK
ncbi:hypothetical protein MIMGU_mgv1a0161592mg, partial [Erythranthe guttata]